MNFKTADVLGLEIFYREAGDPSKPTIVLLHGFPSSSYSFHDLIPPLADRFHVIAPDYPGMGYSEAPPSTVLRPTFDDMTMAIEAFIAQCTPRPVILYMHDIGGPIGMRIATAHPERIAGLVFQNFTIAVEGWNPERLKVYERLGGPETPETLAETEQFATVDRSMFLHKRGARRPEALNPDYWAIDGYAFSIPASRAFMSRLFMNVTANIPHYPEWNAYLKNRQPKSLIVWGRNDPVFSSAAPEIIKQAVPAAELHYFDGGHFVLDEYADAIAEAIIGTFSHDAGTESDVCNHKETDRLRTTRKETTMIQTSAARQDSRKANDATAIRPFHINVLEAELDNLRNRINATRWPEQETVADASQGVQLATIEALARYWKTEYDWRKIESKLNALPQFITEIDGLDIHFIHARSKHENALPLIVTHGWPGSIVEQMKIIDLLTNPTAHGASASDAFDVVIPSIPGYGYSGKPTTTGWDVAHIARAWVVLMKRIGYTNFVAQGGDWGAVITEQMGVQAPPELLGIHTNMPGIFPANIDAAAFSGAPAPSALSADEKVAYERLQFVYQKGIAYGFQMGLRPQTLYGIADSPVGLAAYFLDHDARSYELISRVFEGKSEGLTRDDILDNITITWLTNTALSGARLYWENWGKLGYFNAKGVAIPVAVSVFPDELYPAPRSWAEQAFPKLIHYNRLPKGGHFAAWEQPHFLSEEVRTGFRSLRSGMARSAA